jgi:RHS repeat-associated protein
VRLVTDGTGNQVDTQSHDAYGGEIDGGGEVPPFFTTYEREMTELDYARARYYRSNHRRFTSPDSYRGSYRRGDPQSLNRYAYVANDPINRTDPSGQKICYWVQQTETYGYWDCSLDLSPTVTPNPDRRRRPNLPDDCKLPSWDKLPQFIKDMIGPDGERIWNGMSEAHQITVLRVVASMIANGLEGVPGFYNLQIVGIENGVVRFSGAQDIEQAFRDAFIGPQRRHSPYSFLRDNFSRSSGFGQLFHGFNLGFRSMGESNSLHLTFEGSGILEVHIDVHGSGGKHFFLDGAFRGFQNPDPYKVWNSLMKDDKVKDYLRMLLDCPPPEGRPEEGTG